MKSSHETARTWTVLFRRLFESDPTVTNVKHRTNLDAIQLDSFKHTFKFSWRFFKSKRMLVLERILIIHCHYRSLTSLSFAQNEPGLWSWPGLLQSFSQRQSCSKGRNLSEAIALQYTVWACKLSSSDLSLSTARSIFGACLSRKSLALTAPF